MKNKLLTLTYIVISLLGIVISCFAYMTTPISLEIANKEMIKEFGFGIGHPNLTPGMIFDNMKTPDN